MIQPRPKRRGCSFMSEFIKIEFEFLSDEQKEILIALLSEMNYEGFEEEGDLLKAYIPSKLYNETDLRNLTSAQQLSFALTELDNKNWNQLWESSFHPVVVDHPVLNKPWVGIRAEFHQPLDNVEHEIIITPRMSFGTGHHVTTLMMMQMMSELDFREKSVLDFGTGTGILAILAERLGALRIVAVDNDFQSIKNASENFISNHCKRIQLMQASSAEGNSHYDIILSNIVKSVIVGNFGAFSRQLGDGGVVLLSGLLEQDEDIIVKAAEKNGLILSKKISKGNWLGLQLSRDLRGNYVSN
jgi:ribosomal protein L11 methyltransferase